MRTNILAFVAGVWLLQQQATLPPAIWSVCLLLLPLAWWLPRERNVVLSVARQLLLKSLLLAAGFFWATFFAQARLAENLPPAWEGKDISLIGVVASLPQHGERGLRFEFDVEQVLTADARVPPRLQLSWYTFGFRQAPARQSSAAKPAQFHAG